MLLNPFFGLIGESPPSGGKSGGGDIDGSPFQEILQGVQLATTKEQSLPGSRYPSLAEVIAEAVSAESAQGQAKASPDPEQGSQNPGLERYTSGPPPTGQAETADTVPEVPIEPGLTNGLTRVHPHDGIPSGSQEDPPDSDTEMDPAELTMPPPEGGFRTHAEPLPAEGRETSTESTRHLSPQTTTRPATRQSSTRETPPEGEILLRDRDTITDGPLAGEASEGDDTVTDRPRTGEASRRDVALAPDASADEGSRGHSDTVPPTGGLDGDRRGHPPPVDDSGPATRGLRAPSERSEHRLPSFVAAEDVDPEARMPGVSPERVIDRPGEAAGERDGIDADAREASGPDRTARERSYAESGPGKPSSLEPSSEPRTSAAAGVSRDAEGAIGADAFRNGGSTPPDREIVDFTRQSNRVSPGGRDTGRSNEAARTAASTDAAESAVFPTGRRIGRSVSNIGEGQPVGSSPEPVSITRIESFSSPPPLVKPAPNVGAESEADRGGGIERALNAFGSPELTRDVVTAMNAHRQTRHVPIRHDGGPPVSGDQLRSTDDRNVIVASAGSDDGVAGSRERSRSDAMLQAELDRVRGERVTVSPESRNRRETPAERVAVPEPRTFAPPKEDPVVRTTTNGSHLSERFSVKDAAVGTQEQQPATETSAPAPVPGERVGIQSIHHAPSTPEPGTAPAIGIVRGGHEAVSSVDLSDRPTPPPTDVRESKVTNQIVRGARFLTREGANQVTLRLDPPDLGEVTIRLASSDKHLTGEIRVESRMVQELVSRNIGELRESLASQGIQVDNINVSIEQAGRAAVDRDGGTAFQRENTDRDRQPASDRGSHPDEQDDTQNRRRRQANSDSNVDLTA